MELLDGGVARLPRNHGNFLAIRDGRPVLIVESYGKAPDRIPLGRFRPTSILHSSFSPA